MICMYDLGHVTRSCRLGSRRSTVDRDVSDVSDVSDLSDVRTFPPHPLLLSANKGALFRMWQF